MGKCKHIAHFLVVPYNEHKHTNGARKSHSEELHSDQLGMPQHHSAIA